MMPSQIVSAEVQTAIPILNDASRIEKEPWQFEATERLCALFPASKCD